MDTYLMMLYVSLEQEIALKKFFIDKGWKYRKPDLSHFTDEVGPIRLDLQVDNESCTPAPKITSARSRSAVATLPTSSMCTRSKRKHQIVNEEEVHEGSNAFSVMGGVDAAELNEYIDDGDEDDDFVDDYTNLDVRMKSTTNDDTLLAKLDGTTEDINSMTTCQESSGCDNGKNNSSSEIEATRMDRKSKSKLSTSFHESEKSDKPLRYQCGKCLQMLCNRKDLNDHLNENACVKCKVELVDEYSGCDEALLDEVEDIGSNITDLNDTIDNKSSKDKMNFEGNDTDERFKSPDLKKYAFQCDKCDGAYSTIYNLKLHQMTRHRMVFDKSYKCSSCSATCGSAYLLKLHQENIHKTNLENKESYVCDECSEILYTNKSFISHKKKAHNVIVCFEPDKQYQCDVCGKNFCRKDTMKDHKDIVHLKTRCRKLKMKPTERKFVCDFCGFAFLRQGHLSEHINSKHKGTAKKHSCEECGKSFLRPYQLEYHKNKVHLKKKLYKCDVCNKDFYTLRNVKQHRDNCLMDDKNKKVCTHCGKKFTQQHNLDMHIEAVHSDSPPTCECGVVVKWRSSMAKHRRKCVLYGGKQGSMQTNKLSRQVENTMNTAKDDLYETELDIDRSVIVSNAAMDLGIDTNAELTTITTDAGEQVVQSDIANALREEGLLIEGDMSGTLKVEDSRISVPNDTGTQSVYYVILKE